MVASIYLGKLTLCSGLKHGLEMGLWFISILIVRISREVRNLSLKMQACWSFYGFEVM